MRRRFALGTRKVLLCALPWLVLRSLAGGSMLLACNAVSDLPAHTATGLHAIPATAIHTDVEARRGQVFTLRAQVVGVDGGLDAVPVVFTLVDTDHVQFVDAPSARSITATSAAGLVDGASLSGVVSVGFTVQGLSPGEHASVVASLPPGTTFAPVPDDASSAPEPGGFVVTYDVRGQATASDAADAGGSDADVLDDAAGEDVGAPGGQEPDAAGGIGGDSGPDGLGGDAE